MNGEPAPGTNNACSIGPFFMAALSLIIFFGWQVTTIVQQRRLLGSLIDQQTVLINQAAQVEGAFKAMMTDLVALAATDADARAIVSKYRISFNSAAQPGLPAEPGPGKGENLSK